MTGKTAIRIESSVIALIAAAVAVASYVVIRTFGLSELAYGTIETLLAMSSVCYVSVLAAYITKSVTGSDQWAETILALTLGLMFIYWIGSGNVRTSTFNTALFGITVAAINVWVVKRSKAPKLLSIKE